MQPLKAMDFVQPLVHIGTILDTDCVGVVTEVVRANEEVPEYDTVAVEFECWAGSTVNLLMQAGGLIKLQITRDGLPLAWYPGSDDGNLEEGWAVVQPEYDHETLSFPRTMCTNYQPKAV